MVFYKTVGAFGGKNKFLAGKQSPDNNQSNLFVKMISIAFGGKKPSKAATNQISLSRRYPQFLVGLQPLGHTNYHISLSRRQPQFYSWIAAIRPQPFIISLCQDDIHSFQLDYSHQATTNYHISLSRRYPQFYSWITAIRPQPIISLCQDDFHSFTVG